MTTIEWTHRPGTKGETWNPIRARNRATGGVGHYCAHVSEGCRNCYAEAMQGWRFDNPIRFAVQDKAKVDIFLDEKVLAQPLRWRRPRTIFVCSMTDLYGPWVPDEWIDKIKAIEALCPQHTFIELTKRPERMRKYHASPDRWLLVEDVAEQLGFSPRELDAFDWLANQKFLPNVWEGTSVEDHDTAQARIRELQKVPAAVRWISFEPMLGPIDCTFLDRPAFWKGIHWAVAGGESGRGARPMHPAWLRWVRERCIAHGIPFFFKQWGAWAPHHPVAGGDLGGDVRSGRVTIVHPTGQSEIEVFTASGRNTIPGSHFMERVGKKAAGRLLDGVEWSMWPEVVVTELRKLRPCTAFHAY